MSLFCEFKDILPTVILVKLALGFPFNLPAIINLIPSTAEFFSNIISLNI